MQTRSVLVTGASRGIGAAIARALARDGWFVFAAARTESAVDALAREIGSSGGRAEGVVLDVGDVTSITHAIDRLKDRDLTLDGLVNNAGISPSAPLVHAGEDLVAKLMRVNFDGPRRLIEAFLPEMKRQKFGRIVNVASSAGLRGYKYVSAYCASKHALVGYSRAAADELEGSGVSVACVCPHYVDSPMTEETVQRLVGKTQRSEADVRAFLAAQNPGGRLVTVDEVAAAVVDLMRDGRNGWLVELDGASSKVLEKR
ncbi:MAG: SDR family oxidoreductase [Planctomycetes bacterium]|nr:SDR family oxidoreductase [Planctomycetota bacterium]